MSVAHPPCSVNKLSLALPTGVLRAAPSARLWARVPCGVQRRGEERPVGWLPRLHRAGVLFRPQHGGFYWTHQLGARAMSRGDGPLVRLHELTGM